MILSSHFAPIDCNGINDNADYQFDVLSKHKFLLKSRDKSAIVLKNIQSNQCYVFVDYNGEKGFVSLVPCDIDVSEN